MVSLETAVFLSPNLSKIYILLASPPPPHPIPNSGMTCDLSTNSQSKGQRASAHITALWGTRAAELPRLVVDLLELSPEEAASRVQEKCPSGP